MLNIVCDFPRTQRQGEGRERGRESRARMPGNMPSSELCHKFKRLRLFEPSVGVLGFIFVTFCVVCGLFYLDYRRGYSKVSGRLDRFGWLQVHGNSTNHEVKKFDFLERNGDGRCDLFEGDWVWDDTYPLYESRDCKFLDQGFRCSENGRPDSFYTKWRWQPRNCNLPRFDAKLMLEKLRNKRLVFVGDSIGRNQWESLMCMLSSAVSDQDSIYEVNGSPITKHKGYLVFKFKEFNCTLEYYRAPFLVLQSRPPPGSPKKIRTTLKLDQMDWTCSKWRDADMLIFNTGHWWNFEKTIRGGCYFQEGSEVKLEMATEDAHKRAIKTVLQWIRNEVNTNKTQVVFRTFAPVHFRGGDWRNGGSCHLETLPELGASSAAPETWSQFKVVSDILSIHSSAPKAIKFDVLNITHMTSRRKDGHASLYYLGSDAGPAPVHRQDCSHWCLPGIPDSWNVLLYALFLKHDEANKDR